MVQQSVRDRLIRKHFEDDYYQKEGCSPSSRRGMEICIDLYEQEKIVLSLSMSGQSNWEASCTLYYCRVVEKTNQHLLSHYFLVSIGFHPGGCQVVVLQGLVQC